MFMLLQTLNTYISLRFSQPQDGASLIFQSLRLTSQFTLHFTYPLVYNNRWSIKDDRATTFLHPSLFSAVRKASPNFKHVHAVMLSSHLFFCLPFLLPLCTVLCRIIFASPVDLVMRPYHLNLLFL